MQQRITLAEFCRHHHIETAFVHRLSEQGLLSLENESGELALLAEDLPLAERLVRMHYDLDVNLEGLEVIQHLLQHIEGLQDEVRSLRNRLRFYEEA